MEEIDVAWVHSSVIFEDQPGLGIGPVRGDGFHGLTTLYQTLELHDLVTVAARLPRRRGSATPNDGGFRRMGGIRFGDGGAGAWTLGMMAEVAIHIEKRLPVQGGLGAGSANAVAALMGLERELGVALQGRSG